MEQVPLPGEAVYPPPSASSRGHSPVQLLPTPQSRPLSPSVGVEGTEGGLQAGTCTQVQALLLVCSVLPPPGLSTTHCSGPRHPKPTRRSSYQGQMIFSLVSQFCYESGILQLIFPYSPQPLGQVLVSPFSVRGNKVRGESDLPS